MAKKRQEDPPKGLAGWYATFGDLMNLLLCFFVLLFSMSTVDAEKFEAMVVSLQSSFSILPSGGTALGDGTMLGSGISQLENLDIYYKEGNSQGGESGEGGENAEDFKEQYEEASLKESEEMAEKIEAMIVQSGIADKIEVDVNGQFVKLTLNGALLFDSGKAEIREEALPLVNKLCTILEVYVENQISIEGHTDNVPINTEQYKNNNVLSMYRALTIRDYFIENGILDPAKIEFTGRGEYNPVADNGTDEGRARNRRVEIKIYNSYYSD